MGPDTHDLVSLLRDSYVDIADRELDELIAYFLALKRSDGAAVSDDEFRRRFDLMALQRNLKALGTFGYQTVTRRNTVYIQHAADAALRPTNLEKLPALRPAPGLLAEHIEEPRRPRKPRRSTKDAKHRGFRVRNERSTSMLTLE